jgi:hypothetical protein
VFDARQVRGQNYSSLEIENALTNRRRGDVSEIFPIQFLAFTVNIAAADRYNALIFHPALMLNGGAETESFS